MPDERTSVELEHARTVREMFSRISPKYDFLNHFLSINIDTRWRKLVRRMLRDVLGNERAVVLDVACGTGDLALEMKKSARAKIIGTDFCRPMLTIAASKNASEDFSIPYVEGDALSLPFADASFDAVSIAFGLRNLSNWEAGLRELSRVIKPNGKLVILEFSTPILPGFRGLFQIYFKRILPKIGGAFSGSQDAYEYLSESVSRFPNQQGLAEMMRRAGLDDVNYKNLTGGIAAIHSATKR